MNILFHPILAAGPVIQCGGVGALPGCNPNSPLNPSDITQKIVITGINLAIFAIAFVAFLFLVKGGISFITSKGSSDKLKAAQKTMIAAVMGLVLAMCSYILVQIVSSISYAPLITPTT